MNPQIDIQYPIKFRATAGAIVYRDNNDQREILLIERRFDGGTTDISLPKGGIEADETAQEAAVREVREETGCEIVLEKYVGSADYVKFHPERERWYFAHNLYFLAKFKEQGQKIDEVSQEVTRVFWATKEQALELITRDVIKGVVRNTDL